MDGIAGLLATLLAVLVLGIGLRLTFDARALAARLSAAGYEFGPAVVWSAGLGMLAAGQLLAVVGVVWRGYRRGRLDSAFAVVSALVALLALFAAVVLAVAGRS